MELSLKNTFFYILVQILITRFAESKMENAAADLLSKDEISAITVSIFYIKVKGSNY